MGAIEVQEAARLPKGPGYVGGVDEKIGYFEGGVAPAAVLPVDGGPGKWTADEVADVGVAATESEWWAGPARPGEQLGLVNEVVDGLRLFCSRQAVVLKADGPQGVEGRGNEGDNGTNSWMAWPYREGMDFQEVLAQVLPGGVICRCCV